MTTADLMVMLTNIGLNGVENASNIEVQFPHDGKTLGAFAEVRGTFDADITNPGQETGIWFELHVWSEVSPTVVIEDNQSVTGAWNPTVVRDLAIDAWEAHHAK